MFSNIDNEAFIKAFQETIFMSFVSTLFVFIFGLLLGITLFATGKQSINQNKIIYQISSIITNILRSIPFLILIVLLVPFTKLIVGTILGAKAALPALIIGATPYYARLVELTLNEKGKYLIETGQAFGASNYKIITKIIIPESLIGIIRGITVTAIMIVGYTSIAGAIGAGGLGNLAYLYGFTRNQIDVTILATLLIIGIILFIQLISDILIKKIQKT